MFITDLGNGVCTKTLFTSVAYDHIQSFTVLMFSLSSLFYADFQDLVPTVSYYAPDLLFAIRDMITSYWVGSSAVVLPAAVFDSYQDTTTSSNSEFTEYLTSFVSFVIYIVAIVTLTRITALRNTNESYMVRTYFYLYSIANEIRFQVDVVLQVFFFMVAYTSMMIVVFDDAQEELLEFFNTMCYYFFLFTLVYYFFKYSLHYFSFLEASKGDVRSTSPFSQFLFDSLNIIAFVLRFLVLMIRLNIYDGVDDVLDSFYIFMADFDEEEYFTDTFFSIFPVTSFDIDLNDDRSFLLEDELDFSADLFTLYFLV